MSLAASFLASGKTREVIFQRADYCFTSCFQFLLGRCALGVVVGFCLLLLLVAPWISMDSDACLAGCDYAQPCGQRFISGA